MFFNIYAYRFFILSSVKNEFITKFTQSKLGLIWMIINPLVQVFIYAIVLSSVLSTKLPGVEGGFGYAVYIMSGMLCWSLFSEILQRNTNVFIENANLIKKMAFPKIVLPVKIVLSALISNLLLLCCIILIFVSLGHNIGVALFHLPILFLLTIALSLSLGVMFGVLNVFVRDIGQMINIMLQFLFWLTPVVYVISIIPEKFKSLFLLNPLASIVKSYQDILVYNKIPSYMELIYPAVFAIVFAVMALFLYGRAKDEMADVL